MKGFDDIASDCENVNIQLLRVIEPPVMPKGGPKYLSRSIFFAKRGEARNLIGAMSELRNVLDTATPMITVAVAGNLDIVRATIGVSSLEELESIANEVGSEKIRPYVENITGLTVRAVKALSVVDYASQG